MFLNFWCKFVQPRWDFKIYFTWGTYYIQLLTLLTPFSQDESMIQTRTYIFEEINNHVAEQIVIVHPVLLLPNYGLMVPSHSKRRESWLLGSGSPMKQPSFSIRLQTFKSIWGEHIFYYRCLDSFHTAPISNHFGE